MKCKAPFMQSLFWKVYWFDRRITYHNLIGGNGRNLLANEKIRNIWLPQFNFANLNGGNDGFREKTKVVLVKPNTDFCL